MQKKKKICWGNLPDDIAVDTNLRYHYGIQTRNLCIKNSNIPVLANNILHLQESIILDPQYSHHIICHKNWYLKPLPLRGTNLFL